MKLQSGASSGTLIALTGGTVTRGSDGMQIVVRMLDSDVHRITQADDLAVDQTSSNLVVVASGIEDMAGNGIVALPTTGAKPADAYTEDTTNPELVSFSIDMDAEEIVLTFNETMDVSSIAYTGIVLQAFSNNLVSYRLTTGALLEQTDDLTVRFSILLVDLNELKVNNIGQTQARSWLSMDTATITDMNGQPVVPLVVGVTSMNAADFTADTTAPVLRSFDLSVDTSTAELRFSESVDTSEFLASELSFHSQNTVTKACPCSICFDNEFMVQNCTEGGSVDTHCQLCDICDANEFLVTPCSADADTACQACQICGDGFYMEQWCTAQVDTVCVACADNNCQSCSGPNDMCQECKTGFVLLDGTCISECPPGMFPTDTSAGVVCDTCHGTCATCNGAGQGNCVTCPHGLTDSSGECSSFCHEQNEYQLVICAADENNNDGTCVDVCPDGTYQSNEPWGSVCYACDGSCLTCSDAGADSCESCLGSLSLTDDGRCTEHCYELGQTPVLQCDAGEKIYDGSCVDVCPGETYLSTELWGDVCQPCSRTCLTCSGPETTDCIDCDYDNHGFTPDGGVCTNVCLPQNQYQPPDGAACADCDVTCDRCVGEGPTNCVACATGFVKQDGICVNSCDADRYLDAVDNTCKATPCAACQSECAKCSGPGGLFEKDCTVCAAGFVRHNGQCIGACPPDYELDTDDNTCKPVVCEVCHSTCATCFGPAADECTSCAGAGVALLGGSCVSDCLSGSFADSNDNICKACGAGCTSCSAAYGCDVCTGPFDNENSTCFVSVIPGSIDWDNLAEAARPPLSHTPEACFVIEEPTSYTVALGSYTLSGDGPSITAEVSWEDLNELKVLTSLTVSDSSTWMSFGSAMISDMDGNAVTEVDEALQCPSPCYGFCVCTHSFIQVTDYTADTTQPILSSFSLSVTGAGSISFNFSEAVDPDTLDMSKFLLQSAPGVVSDSVAIVGGALTVTARNQITVPLQPNDLNAIKANRALAIDPTSTFISVVTEGIYDYTGVNGVVPIATSSPLQVDVFTADGVDPELVAFGLNMTSGVLTLSYSETVDAVHVAPTSFSLQGGATGIGTRITLGGGEISSVDDTVTFITITHDDMNLIKQDITIATSNDSTFLTFPSDAVRDTTGNRIVAVPVNNAIQASLFSPDVISPEVVSFGLNMNSGVLTISFSETVDGSSVQVEHIAMQSVADVNADDESGSGDGSSGDQPSSVRLTTSTPASVFSDSIAITLSLTDLNELKRVEGLCTGTDDTYMAMGSNCLVDMNTNSIVQVDNTAAMQASAVVVDETDPVLASAALNMNAKTLTLSFTETVDVSTLAVTAITIQPTANVANGVASVTLSGNSGSSSADGHTVVINIANADANEIKRITALATSSATSYVVATSATIKDMNNNSLVGSDITAAFGPASFVPDTTPPELESFDLNMDTAVITLRFSETVDAASVSPADFVLVNGVAMSDALSYVRLPPTAVASSSNSHTIEITIPTLELDALKIRYFGTVHLVVGQMAVYDMAGNPVVSHPDGAALAVSDFVADSGSPELIGFDVAMPTGRPPLQLTLRFSESVNIASFNISGLVLQSTETGVGAQTYQFSAATTTQNALVSPTVLIATVTVEEHEQIKALAGLGRGEASTFAVVDNTMVSDTTGNDVATITADAALQVDSHTADITPPTLAQFNLSFTDNIIVLQYSEDVVLSTVNVTKITLQSPASSYTITGTTGIAYGAAGNTVIEIGLTYTDIVALKALRSLATGVSDTFLSAELNVVEDPAANFAVAISAASPVQVTGYAADTSAPVIESFTLNMTDGVMVISFDEVVAASTVLASGLRLQSTSNGGTISPALAGDVLQVDSVEITITLSVASANQVRALTGVAVDINTTFLVVDPSAAQDVDTNQVAAITTSAALQASNFAADLVPPVAVSFDLDLDSGTLTMHFDQPIDGASLVPSSVSLQNSGAAPTSDYQLTGGVVSSAVSTSVVITLSIDDLNEIKRLPLCAAIQFPEDNCFFSFPAGTISDATGLGVPAVPAGSAIAIENGDYTADETAPQMIADGFRNFDLNSGQITLSFDETIDRDSLNSALITLASSHRGVSGANSYNYTLQVTNVVSTVDGTVLVFSVATEELNAIKLNNNLCTLQQNCYIQYQIGMVRDMAGNVIEASATEAPAYYRDYAQNLVQDETAPTIQNFTLNMNAGRLVMTFDESVAWMSLRPQHLTLQSTASSAAISHSLTRVNDMVVEVDGPVMTVLITTEDMNRIKTLQFCSSAADTFLSFSSAMVTDTSANANPVNTVLATSALGIATGGYVPDSTAPRLGAFSLSLDTSLLELTFNEPVATNSINFTALQLLSNQTVAAVGKRLETGSVVTTAPVSTIIVLELSEADVVFYKSSRDIATSADTTFLAADVGAAQDGALQQSVTIAPASALRATVYQGDQIRASLQRFTANMSSRQILLTFNEIIDVDTFMPELFHIQSQASVSTGSGVTQALTSASATVGSDGRVVVIQLSDQDILDLGMTSGLATSATDFFVRMSGSVFADVLGRNVISIAASAAQQAASYVPDQTPPTILQSQVDMAQRTISFWFSEPVDTSSFSIEAIVLQSGDGSDSGSGDGSGSSEYQLTDGSSIFATDAKSVVVSIADVDFNAIALLELLAVDSAFIYHDASLVSDVFGVASTALGSDSAFEANRFTPDTAEPTLVGFDLDIDAHVLTMTFSEPVRASNTNVTAITVQNSGTTPASIHTLTGGSFSTTSGLIVVVGVTVDDANSIKQLPMATARSNTFLSATSSLVVDMQGNSLTALDGLQVTNFTADASAPTLESFDLDMNSSTITLLFSETIKRSTVEPTQITLQNAASVASIDATSYHALTTSTVVQSADSTTITISISTADQNAIKKLSGLATAVSNTFISFTASMAEDMSVNQVTARNGNNGIRVTSYTADTTSPVLESFTINMNTLGLSLTFSETMDASSFTATEINIQQNAGSSSAATSFAVTNHASRSTDDSTVISFVLTTTDGNSLKLLDTAARDTASSHLSFGSGLAVDMANNNVTPRSATDALQTNNYTADTTAPAVLSSSLNMDTGLLSLVFVEPVRISTLSVASVELSPDVSGVAYALAVDSTAVTTSNGLQVDIQIGENDLNNIKARTDLAVSDSTTRVSVANAVTDMATSNADGVRLAIGTYTDDITGPVLVSSQLDMDGETITFSFTETVNASSFDPTMITISSATQAFTLTGAAVDVSAFSTVVTLELLDVDLDQIKERTELATAASNALVGAAAGAVRDMAGVPNTVAVSSPIQVTSFTPDTTPPALVSAVVDMNTLTAHLRFSETVNASSLVVTRIIIQAASAVSSGDSLVRLTGGSVSADDSTLVNISLNRVDSNDLKFNTDLATSEADTFIMLLSDAVADMNQNGIDQQSNALAVSVLIPDTTDPVFEGCGINMNSGEISVTFDETMLSSSMTISGLTVMNALVGATSSYALATNASSDEGEVSATNDDDLVITVSHDDLNAIKVLTTLAIAADSSVVQLALGSIDDMGGNSLPVSTVGCTAFTPDTTSPVLDSFKLDMTNGVITFSFSEAVDASTLVPTEITLHNAASPTSSFPLGSGTTSTADGTVLTVTLSTSDMNELKQREDMATGRVDTYLSITAAALNDMNVQPLVEVTATLPMQASQFTQDSRAADLTAFDLNMDAGYLTLVFTETMNATSIDELQVTLQAGANNGDDSLSKHTLTGLVSSSQLDRTVINISLTKADMEAIKVQSDLCHASEGTFLSVTNELISDQNGVAINAITTSAALPVRSFTADTTPPTLVSFTFNIGSGEVAMSFSETMAGLSLSMAAFSLGNDASSDPPSEVSFGTGTYSGSDTEELSFTVSTAELNAIKAHIAMGTIPSDTFLHFALDAVRDMASNPIQAGALGATSVFADTIRPTLVSFSISMDEEAEQITVTFDETVDSTSLDIGSISLQQVTGSAAVSHTLTDADADSFESLTIFQDSDGTVLVITFSKADADELKRKEICLAADSCFLALASTTIADMSGAPARCGGDHCRAADRQPRR